MIIPVGPDGGDQSLDQVDKVGVLFANPQRCKLMQCSSFKVIAAFYV